MKVQGPRPDPLGCIWGGGGKYRAHYSFFLPRFLPEKGLLTKKGHVLWYWGGLEGTYGVDEGAGTSSGPVGMNWRGLGRYRIVNSIFPPSFPCYKVSLLGEYYLISR